MKTFLFILLVNMLDSCNGNYPEPTNNHLGPYKSSAKEPSLNEIINTMVIHMHPDKMSGNIDRDFAGIMIEHHTAAIHMANLYLKKGRVQILKQFSRVVINDQAKEMIEIRSILKNEPSGTAVFSTEFQKVVHQSIAMMMNNSVDNEKNFDERFVRLMLLHHEGAIQIAAAELKYGTQQTMKILARKIIIEQKNEMIRLKSWLENNK